MSIKNITDKIVSDAKEKQADILAKAKQEAEKLINSKVEEALSSKEHIIRKAEEEAETKKNRIIQSAELKVRNQKLTAKHEVIEKTFKYALDALKNLNETEFLNFLKNTVKNYGITGNSVLRVNTARHALITPVTLSELKSLAGADLTLGEALENNQDGFIVEQKGIQINFTFEALINSLKEDLIFDITKILFE
ncbi:V-type ATP synthase subunit E family protein [Clostridium sp. SYSU_GA19001]|uniref:V-type ATP synthase subunit E n=1 Tax=Clostridium caldaquaticum TaxID=2940653 RepID=UPI00207722DE|nr:V-type ATP synthase subunit E family protein [Clostridium caldaquaticum]MCM8709607.1 V-type ATP synthase subunit E family protein [Clostridium caldaquaticum]